MVSRMKRTIKIKYHDPRAKIMQHGNWIDLCSAESDNPVIAPGEFALISLGVSMQLPKYYEAHIVPRSSTFKKWRIIQTNHMGIIDNEYSGDEDIWKMPVFNPTQMFSHIPYGARICQFRLMLSQDAPWWIKILDLFTTFKFKEVAHLGNKNRGGFGSTGN